MSNYRYKFSIISAVYNVEPFIRDAIESIINQDIGINNIQFILVDDGTKDNSGKICDEYAAKYPDNIFVVHKENGGASSARNLGLELAKGKYVNFFDSDDMLAPNALSAVWDFFEKHYDETDIVAIPLTLFDAQEGDHMLNFKFNGDSRVVDLEQDWNIPHLHISSSFVKNHIIKNVRFDTNLAYAEDGKMAQTVIMERQTIGLVSDTEYLYRKRSSGGASAIQSSGTKPNWYIPVVENFHLALIEMALKKFGFVPKYLQTTIMYELQWRLKQKDINGVTFLSNEEKQRYLSLVKKVLGYIDNEVILTARNLFREHKFFALCLKYGHLPEFKTTESNVLAVFDEKTFFSLSASRIVVEQINVKNNHIEIEGYINRLNIPFDGYDFFALANGKILKNTITKKECAGVCLNNEVLIKQHFSFIVPFKKAKDIYKINFAANINGKEIIFNNIVSGYFLPVNCAHNNSYFYKNKWLVSFTSGAFYLRPATVAHKIIKEVKYFIELFKENYDDESRKAAFKRIAFKIKRRLKIRPVWLISDRADAAGDNGEAFFEYMVRNRKNIDARFVIDENSNDYLRLKKIGPVVKRDSKKHKNLAIISEYILSSHAENDIFNPMLTDVAYFKDIWAKTAFVFLQHGITKNDISNWIGKTKKNFYGIITAAKPEHEFFLKKELFGYDQENIWFTGFCRYDRLFENRQKIISIMPTWRRHLLDSWDNNRYVWSFLPNFEQSDFYQFYNGLLNDARLIAAANKYGYKIHFLPHPTFLPKIDSFSKNNTVSFLNSGTPYREIYARSSLVVTDYSSSAFDFSYLRKPVVYCQFDAETFFGGNHIYTKGYFDDKIHGFGEVETTLETTVDRIIEYMENDCELKDVYRKRIDNFFGFNDKNNCKRVYEKLIEYR